jgi:mono/diheme cytochrome c family protein
VPVACLCRARDRLPRNPAAIEPTQTPPTDEWVLVNVPAGATQVQYGAEVYRLVCSACHGDHAQGLTAGWRSTWAPSDQNCWQSKCHGPSHPPDGFVLPVAPAIAGGGTLSGLATAQDLHDLVQTSMRWQNPNSLTAKDSWAVTAYVLKPNGINPGIQLGPATAVGIRLGR